MEKHAFARTCTFWQRMLGDLLCKYAHLPMRCITIFRVRAIGSRRLVIMSRAALVSL